MIYISPPVGGGGGGLTYVDRGDPASVDFLRGDLTTDGTWRDLDLSSIVPEGAGAVVLVVQVDDAELEKSLAFRKKGNSNAANVFKVTTQVNGIFIHNMGVVFCDANRVIQYNGSNVTFTYISIVVAGWII